jgi:hypothetical protein
MRKLVTIESGMIEPIPGTLDPSYGGVHITEKTSLIIDRNGITTIFDNGMLSGVMRNHRLILNEKSNYQERPLLKIEYFFIRLKNIIATGIQWHIINPYNQFTCLIQSCLQTIFRKSHISDYDLMDLDAYLAKRILPKIAAYKKKYLTRQVREYPPLLFQDEQPFHDVPLCFSDTGELSEEEKAWAGVMDEIIFAMRWLLNVGKGGTEEAFFKEYYGAFVLFKDNKEKYFEQISLAEKRAQKGFELFGKFFTSFWY